MLRCNYVRILIILYVYYKVIIRTLPTQYSALHYSITLQYTNYVILYYIISYHTIS